MNSNQQFVQNQSQRMTLKLSPQMIQSINLLTLPVLELRERILDEAEKNPALEVVSDSGLDVSDDIYSENSDSGSILRNSDKIKSKDASSSFLQFLENQPAKEETLQEHLLAQLLEVSLPEEERVLAESIIQNLDEHGFHFVAPKSLYEELLGAEGQGDAQPLNDEQKARLEHVLDIIRNFDPIGTAFDNARQSLLFQAEKRNAPPLVMELLQNHFEELSNMRVSTFQKRLPGRTAEELADAFDFIKTLEPFPAREFGGNDVQFIVPDVYVYKVDTDSPEIDDHFAIVCEEKDLPVLKLSPMFVDLAKDGAGKEESAFVSEQLKSAEWFLNGLGKRNQTLVNVTREIVRRQKGFFLGYATAPSPLQMGEIAKALDIHEATVSRITSGKYLQCSSGIFALRYFFTNVAAPVKKKSAGVAAAPDEPKGGAAGFSKEEVKDRIRQLIEEAAKEGKKLSDEKISKKLEEFGMSVARRTVSKYRAELNIQSSYDR